MCIYKLRNVVQVTSLRESEIDIWRYLDIAKVLVNLNKENVQYSLNNKAHCQRDSIRHLPHHQISLSQIRTKTFEKVSNSNMNLE